MNHTKPLEKELESWMPRRPSARLKRELFPATAAADIGYAPLPVIPAWAKFAPAFCMLLLAMLFCVGRRDQASYLAVSGGSNVLASLSSNLLAFCVTDTLGEGLNTWSMPAPKVTKAAKPTFEWTKTGHFLSTTDSFPLWKTNLQKL